MKRYGNLYPELCSWPSLLAAYRRARRGTRPNASNLAFAYHLETSLLRLQESLLNHTYRPSPYHYFKIYDPKERTISVAPFEDRIVHHALVGVLEPIFEKTFIHHSYATRKGKGTHLAVQNAQQMLRKNRWFFKTDIDKYFDSIRQDKLLELIGKKIKDREVLSLTRKVISNGGHAGVGLPIGNLTSQFFANVYLNPLDHFIKRDLKCQHYLRYMDDFTLFSNDKAQLKVWRLEVESFLREELTLSLKSSASYFNQVGNGLSFLGTRIYPQTIRIHPDNLRRSLSRLKSKSHEFKQGRLSFEDWEASTRSIWAFLSAYDTTMLRNSLIPLVMPTVYS